MPIFETPSAEETDGWPDRPTSAGVIAWDGVRGLFTLLAAVDPTGVITGFGCASTADQQMAETFFALRAHPRTAGWGA
jgi:hypothetical protein